METIIRHSIDRASEEAVKLWCFACAKFPRKNQVILDCVTDIIINSSTSFAINGRRCIDILPKGNDFLLEQTLWEWEPKDQGPVVRSLREALNRIAHAKRLEVACKRSKK